MHKIKYWTMVFILISSTGGQGLWLLEAEQSELKVWAVEAENRKSYHCPRSKWYGVGQGREIGECQAIREQYKPAVGTGCGSVCTRP